MGKNNKAKSKRNNTTDYVNKFTGEKLSTYPVMAQLLGKEISSRTDNEEKLNKQIEDFENRYVCPFCGEKRKWIPGTNLMVCKNEACKGFKRKGKDTEEVYTPSFKCLSNRGEAIADTLMG